MLNGTTLLVAIMQTTPTQKPCTTEPAKGLGLQISVFNQRYAVVAHAVDSILPALGYQLDASATSARVWVTRIRARWPPGTENQKWPGAKTPRLRMLVHLVPLGDSTESVVEAEIECGSLSVAPGTDTADVRLALQMAAEMQIGAPLYKALLLAAEAASDTTGWEPVKLLHGPFKDGELPLSDRIRFRNGRVLDTGLWETEILGLFRTPRGFPYLVLLGKGCTECDAESRYVYIKRPLELPISHWGIVRGVFLSAGIERGVWGETSDWADSVATDSRAFLGACMSPRGQDYVLFARYRSRTGWDTATRVGTVIVDSLQETTLEGSWAPLDSVLARTKGGSCKELPRLEQVTPR